MTLNCLLFFVLLFTLTYVMSQVMRKIKSVLVECKCIFSAFFVVVISDDCIVTCFYYSQLNCTCAWHSLCVKYYYQMALIVVRKINLSTCFWVIAPKLSTILLLCFVFTFNTLCRLRKHFQPTQGGGVLRYLKPQFRIFSAH